MNAHKGDYVRINCPNVHPSVNGQVGRVGKRIIMLTRYFEGTYSVHEVFVDGYDRPFWLSDFELEKAL